MFGSRSRRQGWALAPEEIAGFGSRRRYTVAHMVMAEGHSERRQIATPYSVALTQQARPNVRNGTSEIGLDIKIGAACDVTSTAPELWAPLEARADWSTLSMARRPALEDVDLSYAIRTLGHDGRGETGPHLGAMRLPGRLGTDRL